MYWFTLVYFERRYSLALLLISLTGLLSGLLITRVTLYGVLSLVTLWLAYSGLTLSSLSLVFCGVLTLVYPMAYPLRLLSPLSLSSLPFLSQYRRYRYTSWHML